MLYVALFNCSVTLRMISINGCLSGDQAMYHVSLNERTRTVRMSASTQTTVQTKNCCHFGKQTLSNYLLHTLVF
jgi:hypothetical protein